MLNTERPHRLYAPDDTGLVGDAGGSRRATRDDIRPLPRRSTLPSTGSAGSTPRPLPGASGAVTAATARSLGRSGRDRDQLVTSARVNRLDSTPWVDVDGKHDRPAYEPSRTGNTALERFVKEQRALRDQPRPPLPRRGVPLATNRRGTMAGGWTGPGEGFRRLQTVPVRPALQREADARPINADADAATRVGSRRRARTTRSRSARQSGDESGDGRTRSASSPSLVPLATIDRTAAPGATVASTSWIRPSAEPSGVRPRPTHHRAASDIVGSHRPMIGVRTATAVATTTAPVAVAAVGVASPKAQAARSEQRAKDRSTAISTELSDQLDARLAELEKSFQELSTAIDKAGGTKQLQSRLAALAGVGGAAVAARTTTSAAKAPAKSGLDADLEAIVRAAMRDAGTPSGVISDAAIARAIGPAGKEKGKDSTDGKEKGKGKDKEKGTDSKDGKGSKDSEKHDATSAGTDSTSDDGTGRRAVETAAVSTAQARIEAAAAQRALDASRVQLAQGYAALDTARAAAVPAKQTVGQRAKAGLASMAGMLRNPFAKRSTGPKPPDAKQAMVATSAQALLALQLAESRAEDAVFERRSPKTATATASTSTSTATATSTSTTTATSPSLGAVVVAPPRPDTAPPPRLRSMSAPLPRADQRGAPRVRSASVPVPVTPVSATGPVGAPIVIAPQPGFRPRSESAPVVRSDRDAPPRRARSSSTPLARSDRDAPRRPRSTSTPAPVVASPVLGAPVRPTSSPPATPTDRPTTRSRSASAGLPVAAVAAGAALPLAQRPLPQAPTAPVAPKTAPPRPTRPAPPAPPGPKSAAPVAPASSAEQALTARIQRARDEMAAEEATRQRELGGATAVEQQAVADRRAAEAAHDSRTAAARQAVAADNRRNKKLPQRLKRLVPFTKKATPSATSVAAGAAVSMSNQSLLREQLRASKAEDATAALREKSVESQKKAKELDGKEARVAELLELIRKAPQDGQKKPAPAGAASSGAASTVVAPPETDPTLVKHAALLGSLQAKFGADDGTSVDPSTDPTMAQILAELRTLQARLDAAGGATTKPAVGRRATLGTAGLAVGGGLKLIGRNTRSKSAPPPPRSAGGVSADDMASAIGAGVSDIDSMLVQTVTRTAEAAAVAATGDDDIAANEDVSQSELVIDSEAIVRMVEQRVLEELDRRGLLNQGELW